MADSKIKNCCWCGEDLEFDKGRMVWQSSIDGSWGHEWCIDKYDKKLEKGKGVLIPIKQMETIEPLDKYKKIGESIGKLVDEKNKAYGDSFNKCSEFLKILYPNGVSIEHYSDMLGIVRVFDKLMRIATAKDALGENPWNDICGYSILKSEERE